jgi:uncharacterized protein YutE (UPF0331/DUF86 family)
MIDLPVLAKRVAAVRDAVDRIREVLPADPEELAGNRTTREVVVLNLFVALQDCLSMATHWLADEGWDVPATYGEAFRALAEHGVLQPNLASRMSTAAGLRNLIAHRYAALDWVRLHDVAANHVEDLLEFCESLAKAAREKGDSSKHA